MIQAMAIVSGDTNLRERKVLLRWFLEFGRLRLRMATQNPTGLDSNEIEYFLRSIPKTWALGGV